MKEPLLSRGKALFSLQKKLHRRPETLLNRLQVLNTIVLETLFSYFLK